jgi:hypothetical protein
MTSSRITAGVHGDFTQYRYCRDDKPLWRAAYAALGGDTCRDRIRQRRALRELLYKYAAWCAAWAAAGRAGAIRDQLSAVVMAGDSFYAALAACDGPAAAILSRHTGRVESLLMEFADMRAATARALASLPEDKGGSSPDVPLHTLLRSLADLWEAERNAPPPRPQWFEGEDASGEDVKGYQDNPFMALCEAVAELGGTKPEGKTALAGPILRAVFKRT